MLRRLLSKPVAWRLGLGAWVSLTRACTSRMIGREPSMITVNADPGCDFERLKKREEISLADTRPCAAISKTPISLVGPKRFLKPRRMRSSCELSPSK